MSSAARRDVRIVSRLVRGPAPEPLDGDEDWLGEAEAWKKRGWAIRGTGRGIENDYFLVVGVQC